MEAVSRASKNTSTRTSTNNDFRHGRVLGHYSRTQDDSDSCATAIAQISLERGLASASSSSSEFACAGGKFMCKFSLQMFYNSSKNVLNRALSPIGAHVACTPRRGIHRNSPYILY